MGFRRRKTRERPGLPEFVAVCLLALALVSVLAWRQGDAGGGWPEAPGHVMSATIRPTHYNAPDYRPKVSVTYEYTVNGVAHRGYWEGYWPEMNSPNALLPEERRLLEESGFPLVVMYDPDEPARSRLHDPPGERRILLGVASVVAFLAAAVYFVRIYPAWKFRWG